MKSLKDTIINEQNFGYTYENALIVALVTLIEKGEEKQVNQILRQWFSYEDEARSLCTFLYRIGYKLKDICGDDEKTPDNITKVLKEIKLSKKTNGLTIEIK